jgi:hypothetical protein
MHNDFDEGSLTAFWAGLNERARKHLDRQAVEPAPSPTASEALRGYTEMHGAYRLDHCPFCSSAWVEDACPECGAWRSKLGVSVLKAGSGVEWE